MIVERLSVNPHGPSVSSFMRANLPPALTVKREYCGYAAHDYIVTRKVFGAEKIASIADCLNGSTVVELLHPQYLSDLTALCESFEAATGRKVVLRYWEGK